MAMQRYSRDRPILKTPYALMGGDKGGDKEQDTAKIAVKAIGANGLVGSAKEPEGQPPGTVGPDRRNCRARPYRARGRGARRWFAKGPVYCDQAVRAAGKGGYAVAIWLAVQAREGSAN